MAATRQCPHCFGEIDSRATACRHCGGKIGAQRGNALGCLVAIVLVLGTCYGMSKDRDSGGSTRAQAPEPEPKLCNFWKQEAKPSERPLVVQALVEQHLNAYDYVPGCIAHPKNANRIAQMVDVFCEGSGQSDSVVLSGIEDLAQDLCGRR